MNFAIIIFSSLIVIFANSRNVVQNKKSLKWFKFRAIKDGKILGHCLNILNIIIIRCFRCTTIPNFFMNILLSNIIKWKQWHTFAIFFYSWNTLMFMIRQSVTYQPIMKKYEPWNNDFWKHELSPKNER